jgi:hypothetical protein
VPALGAISTTHCLTLCQDSLLDRVSSRRHNASMTDFEAATFNRRHALLYITVWLVGLVLAFSGLSPRLTGFGLGLMVPGGGMAFYGHWAEAAISLAGVGYLVLTRRIALGALAWLVAAATPLTHDPHHGYVWMAGQWTLPVISATVAIAMALAAFSSRRAWAGARPR